MAAGGDEAPSAGFEEQEMGTGKIDVAAIQRQPGVADLTSHLAAQCRRVRPRLRGRKASRAASQRLSATACRPAT